MPLAKWFLLLCGLVWTLHASDIGLIRVGENWRFFKGLTAPDDNSPDRWNSPAFDDSSWLVGRAGFSTGTFFGETTMLPGYGAGYRTVFFRKEFSVPDTNTIADLILRLDYDDGFVAYLNGVEVARRGLPNLVHRPVPITAVASFHPRGVTEEIALNHALHHLRPGANTLAIQLAGSGEFDFTACFVPELLANVIRGPFLQNSTPTSTQVIWKTLNRSAAAIEFGTNLNSIQRLEIDFAETNHVATITGLEPGTLYHYRIANRFGPRQTYSDWREFRTLKSSGPITFNVMGDSGWASDAQFQIAEQMDKSPADFLMHVGDITYYGFSHYNADLRCFSIYEKQMSHTPWFVALGNHEGYVNPPAALESFYLPTNSVTGTEHYYSFDHGDVHFVVAWSDFQAGSDYRPGSAQYAWLDQDLARSTKPWKFLFFHHTWRTSSAHNSDDYNGNFVPDSQEMDQSLGTLARRHGVQMVFNGHDHCYERHAPSGGPLSFISGGGGAPLYGLAKLHPDSVQFHSKFNFLRVSVENEEARVEAVGADGKVFDQVHVRRTDPERRIYSSAWNTPTLETSGVGDLNVPGQSFDFTGPPLAAPMGLFTSAGRLFVNNDHEHLYLGFDEVMLRAGEELFLFLETPGLSGVSNLRDLGDGLIDPSGEGADGLDFLANLSFENFSPAIGAILGDEWGDAPAPAFLRAGQTIATGQGAFYLTNGIPLVPAQRLAQFNRSPQDFSGGYEQNADWVELAIPYTALGGLKPGELIRVGAVTALARIETNFAAQSRQLDSGGIGSSVRTLAGITTLEGIQVRLAIDPDPDGDGLSTIDEQTRGTNPDHSDTDGDGLPDGWEVRYDYNPLSSEGDEAALDPDGDAMTNAMESRAGTHPRDAVSRLTLRASANQSDSLRLEWTTVPGKKYKIQFRDALLEPFQDLADPLFPKAAHRGLDWFVVHFSPDLPPRTRYYRVQLVE